MSYRPVVLTFSGHDPCGGAGVQADIEVLSGHRCHPASVITALTEQDTSDVKHLIPQQAQAIMDQANRVLTDLPVNAFKIGLMASEQVAVAIQTVLLDHPDIPVVLDPVLAAGGGAELASQQLITAIVDRLLPMTTVLTPNSLEARRLTGLSDLQDCAAALLAKGCEYVLITGTHEDSPTVVNQLFTRSGNFESYQWDRLPFSYHGSGCTLAAAIAALLAHGLDPMQAILEAQEFTWNSLYAGYQPGKHQYLPNRFFWMDAN